VLGVSDGSDGRDGDVGNGGSGLSPAAASCPRLRVGHRLGNELLTAGDDSRRGVRQLWCSAGVTTAGDVQKKSVSSYWLARATLKRERTGTEQANVVDSRRVEL
jgi:hypothetical protein